MVPTDLNIGFQVLALIQGQIYNPVVESAAIDGMFIWLNQRTCQAGPFLLFHMFSGSTSYEEHFV